MILAIDGVGGDNAPQAVVAGVIDALQQKDMEIWLYGPKDVLEKELGGYTYDTSKIKVIHCSEVISGEDNPIRAVRAKKDSSLVRAVMDVKAGKADAFVCAGNTGALISAASLLLGRIKGLHRPGVDHAHSNG